MVGKPDQLVHYYQVCVNVITCGVMLSLLARLCSEVGKDPARLKLISSGRVIEDGMCWCCD